MLLPTSLKSLRGSWDLLSTTKIEKNLWLDCNHFDFFAGKKTHLNGLKWQLKPSGVKEGYDTTIYIEAA